MNNRDVTMNLDLGTVGVKYEDFRNFGKSYFKYVYKSAYEMINNIINQHRKILELHPCGKESRYNEIANVLTFVGKRGTGKTSAMLSFMESLKDYDKNLSQCDENEMFFNFDHRDVLFTCLDCIDGSLLEKGEDIFQIVLAQMYQKFQQLYKSNQLVQSDEGEFGYQARELQKKLEDLYKKTCALEEMSNSHAREGESYMSGLRTLASSQKLKEEFSKLTEDYLMQMRYKYNSFQEMGKQHFLVITVDDVDLNIQNGFSMLEKIHRYLMLPNIIVLLSIDYQEMLQICMRNFFKVLLKFDSALKNGEEFVRELSVDYLDKVLPMNYRIYLPDISDKYLHYKINEMEQGTKKFLLGSLLQKSGVIFDSQGLKRHFYEPKSMRVLSDFTMLLNCLDVLPLSDKYLSEQDKREIYNICEKNYQFLHADLANRMAFSIIKSDGQRRFFTEKVMKSDVNRALEMAINYAADILDRRKFRENQSYSYGILINMLYKLGRCESEEYKPLSCCLLAYFSYKLTRIYILESMRLSVDGERQIVEAGKFRRLISGSVVGEWEKEMIPQIKLNRESEIKENSYDKVPNSVAFDTAKRKSFSTWFHIELPPKEEISKQQGAEKLEHIIIEIEILYLSLNIINLSDAVSGEWKVGIVETNEDTKEKPSSQSVIPVLYTESGTGEKVTAIRAEFSIFHFVGNSLHAVSELRQLERALIGSMKRHYDGDMPYLPRKKLMAEQYKKWAKDSELCAALPLYSFDLMYNIFKRARKDAKERNPIRIEKGEVYKYIGEVYRNIAEQLKKQEEFYSSGKTEGKEKGKPETEGQQKVDGKEVQALPPLYKRFTECPYVQFFLEDTQKEWKAEILANVMEKLIAETDDQ